MEETATAGDSEAAALPAEVATRRAGRPTTASSWRTSPRGRPGRYVGEVVGRANQSLSMNAISLDDDIAGHISRISFEI